MSETRLERGDLLPKMVTLVPGPRSLEFSRQLEDLEPPGINTLYRGQPNLLWQEAAGANVLDVDGNRFLDFTSGFGVAAIGHRHPKVLAAIARQSQHLVHGLGDAIGHPVRIDLARQLRAIAPIERAQTYFAVSGSDAVEIALKTAQLATGKPGIASFEPSYHGLTLGALAATTRPEFRRPFEDHLHPHGQRLPFACDPADLRQLLRRDRALGCVLLEPIVGREGVLIPPSGWLREIRDICNEFEVLMIVDEIFTGFGRTGAMFAIDHENVRPDLLCCGKALGGGLPIGVVLGAPELMASWRTSGEALHTATFVAHPLACATALAVLDVLADEDLPSRARHSGDRFARALLPWQDHPLVREIRGRGLLWGLELIDAEAASAFSRHCRDRGLLLLAGGPRGRVVQLVPPLTLTSRQFAAALDILERALEATTEERR